MVQKIVRRWAGYSRLDLSLPHHVDRLNTLGGSLSSVRAIEALRRSHLLLGEALLLLDYIVQVLHSPQVAVLRHNSFGYCEVLKASGGCVLINRYGERHPTMPGSHHHLEESFRHGRGVSIRSIFIPCLDACLRVSQCFKAPSHGGANAGGD
jgi:hypothetical protein